MDITLEMGALESVIKSGTELTDRAMSGSADIRQGQLAVKSMGRVTAAVDSRVKMQLIQTRVREANAKIINVENTAAPAVAQQKTKAIEQQKPTA
jgi:hypothetical protein